MIERDPGRTSEQAERVRSPGEQKALEYVGRMIHGSETYEQIVEGLGPSMIAAIDEVLEEHGYFVGSDGELRAKEGRVEKEGAEDEDDPLQAHVTELMDGRKEAVQKLYTDLLTHRNDPDKRTVLVKAIIGDTYNRLRTAEYAFDPDEEKTWERACDNPAVSVRQENGWMYRGVFPHQGEKTVTRGSFNVHVTPELIEALDAYVASGALRANYKFGKPNTTASPTERHDAITIYFLEEPTEEVLEQLSQIVNPYIRGDDLLGRKIANGFYLTEVGSIQTAHIHTLLEQLEAFDPPFAKAVAERVQRSGGGVGMSEAEYYALKRTAEAFGYSIEYDSEEGFSVR